MKRILAFCLVAVMLVCLAGCTKPNGSTGSAPMTGLDDYEFTVTDTPTNHVLITMADGSGMLIELYPDIAPITVQNFKDLVSKRFYDGIIFHRVIEGFMIQGGDPDADGIGGSDRTIKGEFAANGVKNDLKHTRGVLSMARTSNSYNSASSQFFIMHQDASHLDGQYAAFGKVIAGLDTVDKIATTKTNRNNRPIAEQKMATVRFVALSAESDEAGTSTESVSP